MYWIEITEDKITAKGVAFGASEGQKEVSEQIFNALTNLPASFEMDVEGNIISVTPDPLPEPEAPAPAIEEMLLEAYLKIAELEQRLEVVEGV